MEHHEISARRGEAIVKAYTPGYAVRGLAEPQLLEQTLGDLIADLHAFARIHRVDRAAVLARAADLEGTRLLVDDLEEAGPPPADTLDAWVTLREPWAGTDGRSASQLWPAVPRRVLEGYACAVCGGEDSTPQIPVADVEPAWRIDDVLEVNLASGRYAGRSIFAHDGCWEDRCARLAARRGDDVPVFTGREGGR